MKKIFLTLTSLCISTFAFSQWTTNVNDIYYNNGNVGIGITTPSERLSVIGQDVSFLSQMLSNNLFFGRNTNEKVHFLVTDYNMYMDYLQDSDNDAAHILHIRNLASGVSPDNDIRFSTSGTERLTIKDNGFIGVGTASPTKLLEVSGDALIGNLTSRNYLKISSTQWPELRFQTPNSNESIRLGMAHANDSNYGAETGDFYVWSATVNQMPLIVRKNGDLSLSLRGGRVGIGTSSPTEKLEVNGTIRTKKVKVEASGWPDYVFANGYQLMAINQLEAYIKENKHLPEVPSAKEIEEGGQDLGDIQATLLKKVEELTLYLIEQNRKNEKQEVRLKALEKENKRLKKEIGSLRR